MAGFGRVHRKWVKHYLPSSMLYCQYWWWVGRFVPVVIVVGGENTTGAWYWKGLQPATLAYERQKYSPRHKLSKECLMVVLWKCIWKL
jgi:hypothetical protein